jgi:hypothetical protein
MHKLPLAIFATVILFSGCTENASHNASSDSMYAQHDSAIEKYPWVRMMDTIQLLLTQANKTDSVEYVTSARTPFLWFRSGHLLNQQQKHALVIYDITDSTVFVDLYSLHGGDQYRSSWGKTQALELSGPGVSFAVALEDFNFDGTKDVFITESCSNGITICYGYLLMTEGVNSTPRLKLHAETRPLGNLRVNPEKKILLADSVVADKNGKSVCTIEYVWKNDSLVRSGTKASCKDF